MEAQLAGKPLMEGDDGEIWTGIMLFGKADMEAATVSLGLRSYNAGDEVCGYCKANRSNRAYTDLQESAAWRPTVSTDYFTFVERITKPHHPLVDSPFFTQYFIRVDIMHNLDCKGVTSIVAGFIFV